MPTTADFDVPRQLIAQKLQELGLSMKGVSEHIGKNPAYLHQYIRRKDGQKSPKVLPEDVRPIIAALLGLPEEALRPPRLGESVPAGRSGAPMPLVAKAGGREIPVYLDTDNLDPTTAREWIVPHEFAGPVSCGLWITRHRGRLHPGDLAYVRFAQPARQGDVVIALKGQAIVAVGELRDLDEHEVEVGGVRLPRADVTICKVVASVFA